MHRTLTISDTTRASRLVKRGHFFLMDNQSINQFLPVYHGEGVRAIGSCNVCFIVEPLFVCYCRINTEQETSFACIVFGRGRDTLLIFPHRITKSVSFILRVFADVQWINTSDIIKIEGLFLRRLTDSMVRRVEHGIINILDIKH